MLIPAGQEVDREIYLTIRLIAHTENVVLFFHIYAFRIDPGGRRERSVRRRGYWYLGEGGGASSQSGSVNVLRELMQELERLAIGHEIIPRPPDMILSRVVAWNDRMLVAEHNL